MRNRARGFEPAFLLAGALGRRLGLPVSACLVRGGGTERQLGAGRRERLSRARLAMTLAGEPPAVALLVDDVQTTGATLDACARALRAGGTRRVDAVTYARTLRTA
jgi:predicted amidophosphoribosyltransferase